MIVWKTYTREQVGNRHNRVCLINDYFQNSSGVVREFSWYFFGENIRKDNGRYLKKFIIEAPILRNQYTNAMSTKISQINFMPTFNHATFSKPIIKFSNVPLCMFRKSHVFRNFLRRRWPLHENDWSSRQGHLPAMGELRSEVNFSLCYRNGGHLVFRTGAEVMNVNHGIHLFFVWHDKIWFDTKGWITPNFWNEYSIRRFIKQRLMKRTDF